jgi:hypothetical protein
MSSIVISGNTSGAITLSAPNVAGTNTITLPAVTGTMLTNVSTGAVLQVVTSVYSTRQSFSATFGTYYDTALTATITPSSTSNKILVMVTATHQSAYNSTINAASSLGLKRGATRISGYVGAHCGTASNSEIQSATGNIIILDSPATTSAVTYTVQITAYPGSTLVYFNGSYIGSGFDSYITLMEIAG